MEATRENRIARLLQKELSETFRKQTQATHGMIVSVSRVRITPDMSQAKVFLSIFPSNKAEETIKAIQKSRKTIRYEVAQNVRFQLRKMPDLFFYLDDSLDYIQHIDELLKN